MKSRIYVFRRLIKQNIMTVRLNRSMVRDYIQTDLAREKTVPFSVEQFLWSLTLWKIDYPFLPERHPRRVCIQFISISIYFTKLIILNQFVVLFDFFFTQCVQSLHLDNFTCILSTKLKYSDFTVQVTFMYWTGKKGNVSDSLFTFM